MTKTKTQLYSLGIKLLAVIMIVELFVLSNGSVDAANILAGNTILVDGVDDYIEVTSHSTLQPTNAVTTEVWAYQETWTTTRAGIMDHGEHGTASGYGIQVNRSGDNTLSFAVGLNSGCSQTVPKAGISPTSLSGGWHHFVGTFDGSSVKLYVDGVLAATQTLTGTCTIRYIYSGPLRFGKVVRDDGLYNFNGKIDEARLYNRALSSTEVTTHYGAGSGEQGVAGENGLIAGWHFDETSGITATDYSGNNKNGTAVGGPRWSARQHQADAINDISEINITPSAATILWTTTAATDSFIEYGTTTSYGSTVSSASLVTSHSQALSGLSPNTTYHYRISSTPASGSAIVSSDQTFTTLDTAPTDNIFYAAPTGTPEGNGSLNSPWDLATVLAHPDTVEPGATIYLRGGSYFLPETIGGFDSNLEGTEEEPITVTSFPDEWAVIDGNLTSREYKNQTLIQIYGDYVHFKNFEITNTETTNRLITVTGSNPAERRANSVDDYADGTKLINLIIHDTGQGIGAWQQGSNNEYYGNVIYNNGWDAADRGHGHGFYTQNETGYKHYTNNFSFHQFGVNLRTGGTDSSAVRNMKWEGNTFFNGGMSMRGPHIENMEIIENYTWNMDFKVGDETNTTYLNATVRDNYFMHGVQMFDFYNGASFTNNTVWSPLHNMLFVLSVGGSWTPSRHTIDNNTYYQGFTNFPYWNFRVNQYDYPTGARPPGVNYSSNYAFNSTDGNQVSTFAYICGSTPDCPLSWQEDLGFDQNSTFVQAATTGASAAPTVNKVVVHDNAYDANRADIIIYNWELDDVVPANVSAVLSPGDTYELRNVQDYFGDVITGTYSGGELSIPMTGRTMAKPIGYDEVATWYHDPLDAATFPTFGSFILKKTSSADVTAPVISAVNSSGIGANTATVTWTTDELSDSQVEYGVTTSYGSSTAIEDANPRATAHSVNISSLTPSTVYHYRVKSRDAAGNLVTSGDNTFTTTAQSDVTEPVRSAGSPAGTLASTTTATTISLTTNEAATCKYSTSASVAYGSMSSFSTTGGTSHSTPVSGLTSSQSYSYYVKCMDLASNVNATDYTISFAVAAPSDTTPPVRSAGAPTGALAAGTTNTNITLTTNESATCKYSTSSDIAYDAMTSFITTSSTNHSTAISGLSNGQTYNYYIKCSDASSNTNPEDYEITFSVTAAADTTPPTRSNGSPSGTLAAGTTTTTLALDTSEAAICKWSSSAGVAYGSMSDFTTTGGTSHTTGFTGLVNNESYHYYVKCADYAANVNTDDYSITFSVAGTGGGGGGGRTTPKPEPVPIPLPGLTKDDNFMCAGTGTVFYYANGKKEAYPDLLSYQLWNGNDFSKVKTITQAQCDTVTYYRLVRLPERTLIKVLTDPTIYRLENMYARPFASLAAFNRETEEGEQVQTTTIPYLHTYPRGEAIK